MAAGIICVALLAGACGDGGTPIEATAEPGAAALFASAAATPPGQLRRIDLLDDCLASDPGWGAIGGCLIADGRVSLDDFLAALPQGHPSWRNDPAYAKVRLRGASMKPIDVTNAGGRDHTFTKVAEFGGGIIPILNAPGQDPVPECEDPTSFGASFVPPGGRIAVDAPDTGVHRYQCCFHPWMRTELRVE